MCGTLLYIYVKYINIKPKLCRIEKRIVARLRYENIIIIFTNFPNEQSGVEHPRKYLASYVFTARMSPVQRY